MGLGLNLKWGGGLSVQSPISTSSSCFPSSYSLRGKDSCNFLARLSIAAVICGETEALNETSRARACSSSPQLLENYYLGTGEIKMAIAKGYDDGLYSLLNDNGLISDKEDKNSSQDLQFSLLMKNLDMLEEMFADSDTISLEQDILNQLERLGALRLFRSCLSRILKSSPTLSYSPNEPTKIAEDSNSPKLVVQSGKKELRKLRRKRGLEKERGSLETILNSPRKTKLSAGRKLTRSRNKRQKVAKNEAEMSSGVKLVSELENIKILLEEETGRVANLSNWAEAARVDKRELQHHLHYGWHCRDELLRSTRSLVLFIARNYWGLGVAFEDLIQAGNIGVLQGAERFDQSKGYKFSTYVQYWIRKSMSTLVSRHARGIRVPCTLSKVINQVQKARKTLRNSQGKYPNDKEISNFTGLSIAKIMSASKCFRVVASIDQKIGEYTSVKHMEVIPDTTIKRTEETVIRQQIIKDVYMLLDGLEAREKQVVILRFGLENHQRKSLEEIGKLFGVSKEWIRKIERAALSKLRSEDSLQILSHYVHMQ